MERTERLLLILGIGLVGFGLLFSRAAYASPGKKGGGIVWVPPWRKSWEELVEKYATQFGVPVALAKAIVMVESGGDPSASRKENDYYSYGLMGITYPTARDMGFSGNPSELFDPEVNVYYGVKYLRWLMDRPHIDHDIEKIAAGYNAGPDLYPWPAKYIGKVKFWMRRFEK